MAVVIISGGQTKTEKTRKLRCLGCEYLHENGNCLKVGGFYTSIADKYCPKIAKDYNKRRREHGQNI